MQKLHQIPQIGFSCDIKRGIYIDLLKYTVYFVQHCFICRLTEFTVSVSEDSIELNPELSPYF
jgi:hypothetical protein